MRLHNEVRISDSNYGATVSQIRCAVTKHFYMLEDFSFFFSFLFNGLKIIRLYVFEQAIHAHLRIDALYCP